MKFRLTVFAFALSFLVLSCSKKSGSQNSDLFDTSHFPNLILKNAVLDKDLLFQSVLIESEMGVSRKSRLVSFKKVGNKVLLFESSKGHVVSNEIPVSLLIADFEIIKENSDSIELDFNKGMYQIFSAIEWPDEENQKYDRDHHFSVLQTRSSFLKEMKLATKESLIIHQVMQTARAIEGKGEVSVPVQVKYYLSPYNPDSTYEKVTPIAPERMRFFETAPLINSELGTSQAYVTRFHPKQPIVYAISANTPAQYRQAMKEGILFWNKIFGEERVKAIDAPAGVVAPDFHYNVVQWVTDDSAEAAYADAQVDPLTGQILHAQVYFPSIMAMNARADVRKQLKRFAEEENKSHSHVELSLKGFKQGRLCSLEARRTFSKKDLVRMVADSTISDSQILKISQDKLRNTIAHEIGHTLGLRHNFAGSLVSNLKLSDTPKEFVSFVKTGNLKKDILISNSVMDYLPFMQEIMHGYQIASGTIPEYDRMAIRALYFGEMPSSKNSPFFCTDSDQERFLDCTKFDSGASPIEFAIEEAKDQLESLPFQLAEVFINFRTDARAREEANALAGVSIQAQAFENGFFAKRALLAKAFKNDTHFLKVLQRTFDPENAKKAERDFVQAEITRVSGNVAAAFEMPKNYYKSVAENFSKIVRSPEYRSGTDAEGNTHSFSDEDIEIMEKKVANFLKNLRVALADAEINALSEEQKKVDGKWQPAGNRVIDHAVGVQFMGVLEEKAWEVLTAIHPSKQVEGIPLLSLSLGLGSMGLPTSELTGLAAASTALPKLPQFTYPYLLRLTAAKLLNSPGESLGMGVWQKSSLKNRYAEFLETTLGKPFDNLKPDRIIGVEATSWILENQVITKELE